ncbi:MAG: hypothetical protein HY290_23545, partial [Planctomycetia bacterium]|nr:hypothetical protein [Planctomycetia bacterium]
MQITNCRLNVSRSWPLSGFSLAAMLLVAGLADPAAAEPPRKWLKATAYVVPKETASEGEGYFSIIEGLNGRLYVGTHANAVNSWLVEFDPQA